ncbi:prepilin-type N-terminal cleavage/methylation domain-containing protein [Asticcacaulis sp. 201]|uniref:prepilin-type N-terminal cleavage/methylation domain-containing protein n=1 Tax=Asticcacaulis sp. 201 TaxID=3028787 RepID=UPI0029168B07|nr:prepilin-type N-terminal cleavage/methylation domain-containing protein [Asticcacaulis sp. 201]MDV6331309.1 prepilin-type N-terminal cleavage/methylation domain-containing protein [Asticcacaulis sp. 201]
MTKPSEAGFTLAEMLVALVVISLALAGIWQGSRIVSRLNMKVEADRTSTLKLREYEAELRAKLEPLQPILGDAVIGSSRALRFACQAGEATPNCALSPPSGTFAYVSNGQVFSDWPPLASAETPGQKPRLQALIVRNTAEKNLIVVTLPVEHPADCQFDMISRACREVVPADE